jgi:hypothetical protein
MKKKQNNSPPFIQTEDELWKLYTKIGKFAERINRLPDAAESRKVKRKSAPLENTPMIF